MRQKAGSALLVRSPENPRDEAVLEMIQVFRVTLIALLLYIISMHPKF